MKNVKIVAFTLFFSGIGQVIPTQATQGTENQPSPEQIEKEDEGWKACVSRYENWQKKVMEYCTPSSHVIREVFQGRTLFRESPDWIKSMHKDGAHETIAFAKRGDRDYSTVGAYLYALVHKKNPCYLEDANSGVSTIKNDHGTITIHTSSTHTKREKAKNEEHAAELKKTVATKSSLDPVWNDDYTQCINKRYCSFDEKTGIAQCKQVSHCKGVMPYEKFRELMNNCTLKMSDL